MKKWEQEEEELLQAGMRMTPLLLFSENSPLFSSLRNLRAFEITVVGTVR